MKMLLIIPSIVVLVAGCGPRSREDAAWAATRGAPDTPGVDRKESSQTGISEIELGRIEGLAGEVILETAAGGRSTPPPGSTIRDGETLTTGADGQVWIELPVENPHQLEAWGMPGSLDIGPDSQLRFTREPARGEGPDLWVISLHRGSWHVMIGRSRERIYRAEAGSARSSIRFGHTIVDAIVARVAGADRQWVLLREGQLDLEAVGTHLTLRAGQQVSIVAGQTPAVQPLDPELWEKWVPKPVSAPIH